MGLQRGIQSPDWIFEAGYSFQMHSTWQSKPYCTSQFDVLLLLRLQESIGVFFLQNYICQRLKS